MVKRLIDLCGSLIGLVFLSPILFILALLVRLDSPGPAFYRGVRVGRFGKPFPMFKFRTMVANAEQVGGPSSATDDVRITRVGRFLRQYKLDEVPQLINVLRGEMSLVGPRPEVLQYVAMFSAEEKAILSVAPGITDWASVWNRDEGKLLAGSHDPEKVYLEQIRPEKIRLQLEYVRNQSLTNDIRILLATFKVLLFGRLEAPVLQERSHDPQR